MTLVLVVDDVPALAEQYAYDLKRLGGYDVQTAREGSQALELVKNVAVDCMILDLEMPGMDGFEVLRRLDQQGSEVPVVVYTGTGNYERCIAAIRLGAYSFIDKAEPMERVVREVETVLERRRLRDEVAALQRQLGLATSLVGSSAAIQSLREAIARVAPIPSPVLILGESGSGKELVARDLHRSGAAPDAPFIAINSAALPETLVESELFGHERGAFTGAATARKGAFEAAGRGTLFLDEIGELPLPGQAKLLRVLEDRQVVRLGGNRPIGIEARVVAATNRDLEEEIKRGSFRSDLFYRLNVIALHLPPLRDRRDDIPLLAESFLARSGEQRNEATKRLTTDAAEALQEYAWPGNVRELENALERAVILSSGGTIDVDALPERITERKVEPLVAERTPANPSLETIERAYILWVLQSEGGNKSRAAEVLGIDPSTLYRKLSRFGVEA